MDFAIADLEKNKKALAEKQALFLCIRQNLVFRAIFGSVSDDKYFLLSKNAFGYHDVVDKITN